MPTALRHNSAVLSNMQAAILPSLKALPAMHPTAQQYLREIRRSFKSELVIPVPPEPQRPEIQQAHARWARYIHATFDEDLQPEIDQHAWNMPYWMERLESKLYEDLADYCLNAHEQQALQQVAVAYLPLQNANACALPVPCATAANGAHAIVLELGLIWTAFLLTEGLLLAAEGMEEAAHDTYQRLLAGYQHYQLAPALEIWRVGSALMSEERISLQAGAVSTVILRFVALHELGHVVLGHVEHAGMGCTLQGYACEVRYAHAAELGQATTWAMEEAADDFALAHMLAHTGSAQQMWNNMLFIGLMFRLWDHLWRRSQPEATPWPVDSTHPPPLARLERLTLQVQAALGPPPNDAPLWAELTFTQWCEPWPATAEVQAPSNQ